MVVHIRLQESPIANDGVREQPRGLQVVARGLCQLPPNKVRATWRFISGAGDKEGHPDFPARRGLLRPRGDLPGLLPARVDRVHQASRLQ